MVIGSPSGTFSYYNKSGFFSLISSFSILNKLTPEKFDKLCLELLNVGVDSKLVLKGIILLVRWQIVQSQHDPLGFVAALRALSLPTLSHCRLWTKPLKSPSIARSMLSYVCAWQRTHQTLIAPHLRSKHPKSRAQWVSADVNGAALWCESCREAFGVCLSFRPSEDCWFPNFKMNLKTAPEMLKVRFYGFFNSHRLFLYLCS